MKSKTDNTKTNINIERKNKNMAKTAATTKKNTTANIDGLTVAQLRDVIKRTKAAEKQLKAELARRTEGPKGSGVRGPNKQTDAQGRNASQFIRDHEDVPATELVQLGAEAGLTFSTILVYQVRRNDRLKAQKERRIAGQLRRREREAAENAAREAAEKVKKTTVKKTKKTA
jgi:hypothetical protein